VIKESKMMRASVELHGEFTRGQVAIDWTEGLWIDANHPKVCRKRTPITFVTSYNVPYLDKLIFDTIHRHNNNKSNGTTA